MSCCCPMAVSVQWYNFQDDLILPERDVDKIVRICRIKRRKDRKKTCRVKLSHKSVSDQLFKLGLYCNKNNCSRLEYSGPMFKTGGCIYSGPMIQGLIISGKLI